MVRKHSLTTLTLAIKCAVFSSVLLSSYSWSAEEFNLEFVRGNNIDGDTLKNLARGQDISPGRYPFDIYINNVLQNSQDIMLVTNAHGIIEPCFTAEMLEEYGILRLETPAQKCAPVSDYNSLAKAHIKPQLQSIEIEVSQDGMDLNSSHKISPNLYDNGINALFTTYSVNYNNYSSNNSSGNENSFFSFNSGLNVGAFRLRHNGTLYKYNSHPFSAHTNSVWGETDIIPWRSRLVVGQSMTRNDVFDSFQFKGIQLSSVSELLPSSLRNYAPFVRGVAKSNARVDVIQNGYLIYSTNVSPGPFTLRDVGVAGVSGDLHVTITEADGSKNQFVVAYSSLAMMLREGISAWQATAGRYTNGSGGYSPQLIQATWSRGFRFGLTPYTGVVVADHYHAAALGLGASLGSIGAISFDTTFSDTSLASGDNARGQSYRLLYSKSLLDTGTAFQLAGYRYATNGFYGLSDAVNERNEWEGSKYKSSWYTADSTHAYELPKKHYRYSNIYNNRRQRTDISVSQQVAQLGSLNLTYSWQSYWGSKKKDLSTQVGFSSSFKNVSWSVYYQNTKNRTDYHDESVNFNLSFPLSWGDDDKHAINVNTNFYHSRPSYNGYSTGITGDLLENKNLFYAVSTSKDSNSPQSHNLSLSYNGNFADINTGYSYSRNYRQMNAGLRGGVVLHSGGVTLSQPLGNTFTLIEAKDANDVLIQNNPGIAIDHFGYAVVPYASAYNINRITLDTESLPPDLEIPINTRQIIPTEKAVGKTVFNTYSGKSLLIHSQLSNGESMPVGALVINSDGREVGIMGLNDTLYVAGVKPQERLTVHPAKGTQNCTIKLPKVIAHEAKTGYEEVNLPCTL